MSFFQDGSAILPSRHQCKYAFHKSRLPFTVPPSCRNPSLPGSPGSADLPGTAPARPPWAHQTCACTTPAMLDFVASPRPRWALADAVSSTDAVRRIASCARFRPLRRALMINRVFRRVTDIQASPRCQNPQATERSERRMQLGR